MCLRRISLGGEDNALYPVLSKLVVLHITLLSRDVPIATYVIVVCPCVTLRQLIVIIQVGLLLAYFKSNYMDN